jgi:demethylmenaquinone methyltransferase/2-methoxy-6-polyprenyl-1,4-benzoquinol methylase
MFGRIARRYDAMNRLMSAGMDGAWRRRAASEARVPHGGVALDVGTGTGDLAIALARSAPGARAVGVDYTPAMLRQAPAKGRARDVGCRATWVLADGARLPFAESSFDAVASAFVLRNLEDLLGALREMARVTRPGGRVVALEMSPDAKPAFRPLFWLYFGQLVPLLGRALATDGQAYTYLPASVAVFVDRAAVARAMEAAGLSPLPALRMMLGAVVLHRAEKPKNR